MSVNGVSNQKVMPVFGGFGAQNQNHQKGQNQQNGGQQKGDGFDSTDKFIEKVNVPVHNVSINPINNSPTAGKNYYKIAKWETEKSLRSRNVKIIAELHGTAADGTIKVHIIHDVKGQKTRIETIDGFLTKGVVSASWQTKNKVPNWNQGVYKFIVAGGGAGGESSNDLVLV